MYHWIYLGIKGVYKGLTATIIKQGSNQAIRFFTMDTLKDMYRGGDKDKKIPTYVVGAFGAFAGKSSQINTWEKNIFF